MSSRNCRLCYFQGTPSRSGQLQRTNLQQCGDDNLIVQRHLIFPPQSRTTDQGRLVSVHPWWLMLNIILVTWIFPSVPLTLHVWEQEHRNFLLRIALRQMVDSVISLDTIAGVGRAQWLYIFIRWFPFDWQNWGTHPADERWCKALSSPENTRIRPWIMRNQCSWKWTKTCLETCRGVIWDDIWHPEIS